MCGTYGACIARKSDRTAVAWGESENGGDASGVDLTNVVDAMCGDRACVAIISTGTLAPTIASPSNAPSLPTPKNQKQKTNKKNSQKTKLPNS